MDELVQFRTDDGAAVTVAATGDGLVPVGAGTPGPLRAARTFEDSLDGARAAAQAALRVFRDGSLRPDTVEIEFGVKLTAETGAVIVKGTAEGHLVVRLTWSADQADPPAADHGAPGATSGA